MSTPVDVAPALACAIAVQKELAGGLTRTASGAVSQNGYSANTECTAACSFNYNECFLPTAYVEAYAKAETDAGAALGAGAEGGSACPDAASVTVTCTYTSAGFCE